MKCPDMNQLREDWQRSKRGLPMLYSSHIANCNACKKAVSEFESLSQMLAASDNQVPDQHPDIELQVAYIEKRLSVNERNQIESHLADCSECRNAIASIVEATQEDRSERSSAWIGVVNKIAYGAIGAAAVLLAIAILPVNIPKLAQTPGDVSIVGTKGDANPAISALRAIEPSDKDLDFAIAVWKKAYDINPGDKVAREKIKELEQRKASQKSTK